MATPIHPMYPFSNAPTREGAPLLVGTKKLSKLPYLCRAVTLDQSDGLETRLYPGQMKGFPRVPGLRVVVTAPLETIEEEKRTSPVKPLAIKLTLDTNLGEPVKKFASVPFERTAPAVGPSTVLPRGNVRLPPPPPGLFYTGWPERFGGDGPGASQHRFPGPEQAAPYQVYAARFDSEDVDFGSLDDMVSPIPGVELFDAMSQAHQNGPGAPSRVPVYRLEQPAQPPTYPWRFDSGDLDGVKAQHQVRTPPGFASHQRGHFNLDHSRAPPTPPGFSSNQRGLYSSDDRPPTPPGFPSNQRGRYAHGQPVPLPPAPSESLPTSKDSWHTAPEHQPSTTASSPAVEAPGDVSSWRCANLKLGSPTDGEVFEGINEGYDERVDEFFRRNRNRRVKHWRRHDSPSPGAVRGERVRWVREIVREIEEGEDSRR